MIKIKNDLFRVFFSQRLKNIFSDLLRYSMSNHSKVPPGKCDPAYKPWKLQKKGRHFNGCKHAERVNMKDFGGAVISAGRLMSQMDCAED